MSSSACSRVNGSKVGISPPPQVRGEDFPRALGLAVPGDVPDKRREILYISDNELLSCRLWIREYQVGQLHEVTDLYASTRGHEWSDRMACDSTTKQVYGYSRIPLI